MVIGSLDIEYYLKAFVTNLTSSVDIMLAPTTWGVDLTDMRPMNLCGVFLKSINTAYTHAKTTMHNRNKPEWMTLLSHWFPLL